jgi:hypothetical protein
METKKFIEKVISFSNLNDIMKKYNWEIINSFVNNNCEFSKIHKYITFFKR